LPHQIDVHRTEVTVEVAMPLSVALDSDAVTHTRATALAHKSTVVRLAAVRVAPLVRVLLMVHVAPSESMNASLMALAHHLSG
jgi:hypothetical protein